MKRTLFWLSVAIIALMLVAIPYFQPSPQVNEKGEWVSKSGEAVMNPFYGWNNAKAILKDPDQVLIYGIKHKENSPMLQGAQLLPPVTVSKELRARLSEAFSYPGNYVENELACEPTYGMLISFQKGAEKVNFLYCLMCGILAVDTSGKKDFRRFGFGNLTGPDDWSDNPNFNWVLFRNQGRDLLFEIAEKYLLDSSEMQFIRKLNEEANHQADSGKKE
ncbi:MAG TPA: hypothetical protein V6C52_14615 [Coleofasciculaceae cyanobacterium]